MFNKESTINALRYIYQHLGENPKLRMLQIIYFADCRHLALYGRTITESPYIAKPDAPFLEAAADYFSLSRKKQEMFFNEPVNMECLSVSDLEVLNYTIKKYKKLSWKKILVALKDKAWSKTPQGEHIAILDMAKSAQALKWMLNYITEDLKFFPPY